MILKESKYDREIETMNIVYDLRQSKHRSIREYCYDYFHSMSIVNIPHTHWIQNSRVFFSFKHIITHIYDDNDDDRIFLSLQTNNRQHKNIGLKMKWEQKINAKLNMYDDLNYWVKKKEARTKIDWTLHDIHFFWIGNCVFENSVFMWQILIFSFLNNKHFLFVFSLTRKCK